MLLRQHWKGKSNLLFLETEAHKETKGVDISNLVVHVAQAFLFI